MPDPMRSVPDVVPLADYSRALDEIYALRRALAYEAQVLETHLLYKTFPKGRREIAVAQCARMKAAARGLVDAAYVDKGSSTLRSALRLAGAEETLTRAEWEAERQ